MPEPTKQSATELLHLEGLAKSMDDTATWRDSRGYVLSDRVWSARQDVRAQIDQVLKTAVATKEDALVTARKLEQYLNPAYAPARTSTGALVKYQPKGIVTSAPGRGGRGSYQARRLARTEISRAHAQATKKAAATSPFSIGWKWNTSTSHVLVDICDIHAENDDARLGPGVYPPNGGPEMPSHPHCLCFATIAQREDVDAVIDDLRDEFALNLEYEDTTADLTAVELDHDAKADLIKAKSYGWKEYSTKNPSGSFFEFDQTSAGGGR